MSRCLIWCAFLALCLVQLPVYTKQISQNDIEDSQKIFIEKLENSNIFENADYSTVTKLLKSPEGVSLVRSLVDATVPAFGRDDTGEIFGKFWKKLGKMLPPELGNEVKKVENVYNSVSDSPIVKSYMNKVDTSKILDTAKEFVSKVDMESMMDVVTNIQSNEKGKPDLKVGIQKLLSPVLNTWLKQNNYNMEAEGIFTLIDSLSGQLKSSLKNADADTVQNMMGAAMSMMANKKPTKAENEKAAKKSGNEIMDTVTSLLSNPEAMPALQAVLGMLGKQDNKDSGNLLGLASSLLGGLGKGDGGNNLKMLAAASKLLMAGNEDEKKKDKGPNMDLGQIAKIALKALSGAKVVHKVIKPEEQKAKPARAVTEDISANLIDSNDAAKTGQSSDNPDLAWVNKPFGKLQVSPLVAAWEPALESILGNPQAMKKVESLATSAGNMLGPKVSGMGPLLAMLPSVLSGVPGASQLVAELQAVAGRLRRPQDETVAQTLAGLAEADRRASVASLLSPLLARLCSVLGQAAVRETVSKVVAEQWATAVAGAGLQGLTLGNWEQRVGPMVGMLGMGLGVKPVPLLKATQTHATKLVGQAVLWLEKNNHLSQEQMQSSVHALLSSLLAKLASVDALLATTEKGKDCQARVVCRAVQTEHSMRAPIVAAFAVARSSALAAASAHRVTVLRAAAASKDCAKLFRCEALDAAPHHDPDHEEL